MSEQYGLMVGKYPAVVQSYSAASRECRVHIPGLTDGGDVGLLAEIEYPIGDRSKGQNPTEIEILEGDLIWVEFEAGDPSKPIITGWRNATSGNSVGWRRWHHANIELLAEQVMNLIAKGAITIKSDVSVTVDTPETICTGNLTVQKQLTYLGGMSGSGGSGAAFEGGSITHNGKRIDDGHTHGDVQPGNGTTSPPNN